MLPYLQEKLDQPDEILFSKGGCHVFAAVLQEKIGCYGYTLRRLAARYKLFAREAMHVYVAKNGVMIDVSGSSEEESYICERRKEWATSSDCPTVVALDCRIEELWRPKAQNDDDVKGVRSEWDLHLDKDFCAACRQRAQLLIPGDTDGRY